MNLLKKGDIQAIKVRAAEQGRAQGVVEGFHHGVEYAVREILNAQILIYQKQQGYGAAMKIPINLDNASDIKLLVFELIAHGDLATETTKKASKGYDFLAKSFAKSSG